MDIATLIIGIVGLIIAVIALPKEKPKEKWKWIVGLPKGLVTKIRDWLNRRKCLYTTKIYLAESKQSNERAYVYIGKKRKLLPDIRWKFSEWFDVIRIKVKKIEDTQPKTVDPCKLGVIQILAVFRAQSHKWEKVPRPYCEETRWVTPQDGIFPEAQLSIYDPDTREPQYERYHDWHKPVIYLLLHPSPLCQNVKAKLKDLKKEYKLSFIPPRDRYEIWGGGAYWKWGRREL